MKKRRPNTPAVRTAPVVETLPATIPEAHSFLQTVRATTSREQLRKNQHLAQLETLYREIGATIAFVKAQDSH